MAETCRAPSMSPASAVTSDFLGESGTRNVTAVSELVREPQGLGCAGFFAVFVYFLFHGILWGWNPFFATM